MKIETLQRLMAEMDQVKCPVFDHFSDGLYARELVIPQGVCIVGARHKTRHLFMVVKGECLIASGDDDVKQIEGPYLTETLPDTKRSIMAITETTIMTFHVTEKTDVKSIGEEILEPEQGKLEQWRGGLL